MQSTEPILKKLRMADLQFFKRSFEFPLIWLVLGVILPKGLN